MKFGQFYIHEQAPGKSAKEVYDDCLEQCRVADELGFDESGSASIASPSTGPCRTRSRSRARSLR